MVRVHDTNFSNFDENSGVAAETENTLLLRGEIEPMTSVDPAPEHLVVVHHGYGGTHHGHAAFCDQIREQHPSTFVLNCTTNSADGAMKEGVTVRHPFQYRMPAG